MKSPFDAELLKIHISTECGRSCSNCVDLAPHIRRPQPMSLEKFDAALAGLNGWLRPGRVLGIAGGEPTQHPDFEEISRRLADYLGLPQRITGRAPAPDLNEFALRRLMERDAVCGLWTSLGDGFYRHYETILDVYGHLNIESHDCGKRHHAVMIDRADYCATTGISDEQWLYNRDRCAYQRANGGAVNDKGAYFCSTAAALDRLLFNGAHAWEAESGWWHRRVADFGDQLSLCDYCALAQPTPAQVDGVGRDIVGRAAWSRLKSAGSPQPLELFSENHRLVSSIANDAPFDSGPQPRVGPAHVSIKPRKLSCVLVSVGYGQALAETLPLNMPHFDQMVVVTTPEDETTQSVAKACGATIVLSRRCYDNDDAFNKGRMLNDGIAALEDPDWILLTDADIVMHSSLRAHVMSRALNKGCLYFTARIDRNTVINQGADSNIEPNGYFQLFHPSAQSIRTLWPKMISEAFCSAGSVDSWFYQQWPNSKLVLMPEVRVEHISSRWLAENWNGLGEKKGRWCQFGLMTAKGLVAFREMSELPKVLRLTDSQMAEVVMVEPKNFYNYVQITDSGLVFQGRLLGKKHIHIAYFDEG